MIRETLVTDVGGQAYLVELSATGLYFVPGCYIEKYFSFALQTVTEIVLSSDARARLTPLRAHEAAVQRLISVYVQVNMLDIGAG